jgi:hypothetical protein
MECPMAVNRLFQSRGSDIALLTTMPFNRYNALIFPDFNNLSPSLFVKTKTAEV